MRPQPSHCLAIMLDDQKELLKHIAKIQELVAWQFPELTEALIPLEKLHLTLHVMKLKDASEIKKVKKCMKKAADEHSSRGGFALQCGYNINLTPDIVALDVLSVHLLDEYLEELHNSLKIYIAKQDVECFDYGFVPFKPHITILNMRLIKGSSEVHRSLMRQLSEHPWLKQVREFDVESIHLFSIAKGDRHSPRYKEECCAYLQGGETSSDSSE